MPLIVVEIGISLHDKKLDKLHLKQSLYSHRMSEGTLIEDFLTTFIEIVANLESMGVKYGENNLALILLCSQHLCI